MGLKDCSKMESKRVVHGALKGCPSFFSLSPNLCQLSLGFWMIVSTRNSVQGKQGNGRPLHLASVGLCRVTGVDSLSIATFHVVHVD